MRNALMRNAIVLAFVALLTMPVTAADLSGVSMNDTIMAGDQRLTLNGMGLRKKAIFKVYVGGLYLPAKRSNAEKILATDEPRRVVMEFVRKVSAEQLAGGWDEGLANNTPQASAEVKKAFATLNTWMEDVGNGDRLEFTYKPGQGTEVKVKGSVKGTLEGKEASTALFACWLGPKPPSADFKDGLLGN